MALPANLRQENPICQVIRSRRRRRAAHAPYRRWRLWYGRVCGCSRGSRRKRRCICRRRRSGDRAPAVSGSASSSRGHSCIDGPIGWHSHRCASCRSCRRNRHTCRGACRDAYRGRGRGRGRGQHHVVKRVGRRPVTWRELEPIPMNVHHAFIFIARQMVEGNTVPDHNILPDKTLAVRKPTDTRSTLDFGIVRRVLLAGLVYRHVELVIGKRFGGRPLMDVADASGSR